MENKVLSKIQLVLEKLLSGKCPNQKTLKNFLVSLSKDEEWECSLVSLPIFTKWIKNAVKVWSTTGVSPEPSVVSFTLSLATCLSKKAENFSELSKEDFFQRLIEASKLRNRDESLAFIKLLSSFLGHTSGLAWLTRHYLWEEILQMSLSCEDSEVRLKSTQFIAHFLEKTFLYDKNFTENLIKRILVPLSRKNSGCDSGLTDTTVFYLKPALKLVGSILDYFLEGLLTGKTDHQVLFFFVRNFCLDEKVSYFMHLARMKSVIFDVGKVVFIIQFLELYVKILAKRLTIEEISDSVETIRRSYVLAISKGNFDDVLDFCNFGHLFWTLIGSKILHNSTSLRSELLVIQLLPIFFSPLRYMSGRRAMDFWAEDVRDNFRLKIFNTLSEDVTRAFYYWRKYLPHPPVDLFKFSIRSMTYIKSSKKYFSKQDAVLIFQTLVYNLRDYLYVIKVSPKKFDEFSSEMSYFSKIIETLVDLIEDYHIDWKDSIESTEILAISFDFVTIPLWSKDVVLEALGLIRIAIANCMAENMALLVDKTADSTIGLLGPLLYAKAYDQDREVRKKIFEIVHTMVKISGRKFPSLQKVLMDSELPTLVVKMSTCDGESFVRATAIKCLQEMIQVEEIWNNALKTEDLPQKMRDILLNEAEGIVRVEAATFMCVAYEYQQFAKENLDRIYETMIYSSTTDLHWEVKIRALNFWDKVIKNHLQNQGMIDDSFPNVTFSKEHRKIVTLTDSEIRKRLLKVLGQLSSIGCLGVLMSAIKDDCDMEVSKTAVKITQRLIDLFKKYNVRSDSSTPNSPALTENGMSAAVSLSSGISVDESMDSPASSSNHPEVNEEIIDQIVNSKDVSLLKSVYTPSDYGSVSNYDIQVRKVVTPNEFLQFCQQDLNSLIAEKKNWLNGIEDLGSLLDDMLKSYEDDVNNMDCY